MWPELTSTQLLSRALADPRVRRRARALNLNLDDAHTVQTIVQLLPGSAGTSISYTVSLGESQPRAQLPAPIVNHHVRRAIQHYLAIDQL